MENIIWVALLCAVLALLFAAWKTSVVSKADAGTERMKEIAGNISDGARAFLFAEYKILVIFVAVLFVLIGLFISWLTAICFLVGAVFSVGAGYVGMNVATKANVRTAAAAKSSGMNKALGIAFSGGSVMGMCVVGLGLLGGKYAQVLSQKGYRVTGITHSQSTLDYALEHAYICEGRNENFDDLVQNADYIIFGLYPTVLLEWVKQYGHLVRPGTLITDVSGVKRGVVEPVQQMLPEGVEFIASHPMAGRETSSVEHAAEVNFAPANFIVTWIGLLRQ